jgi:AraC-like DNA-binding protein/ligand-binding sensor domain-containing protein
MTTRGIKIICLLFVGWLTVMTASAQEVTDFTYSHLGQQDGMISQRVYNILQAKDGALWWATKNGVDRWNGVSIKTYQMDGQQTFSSMAGRYFKLTQEEPLVAFDNKGRIYRYNEGEDRFEQKADVGKMIAIDVEINDVAVNDAGIWIASNKGIYLLNDGKLQAIRTDVHANSIVRTKSHLLFCTRQGVMRLEQGNRMTTLLDEYIESGYYDLLYNKVWLGGFSCGLWILPLDKDDNKTGCEHITTEEHIMQSPIRCFCPYDEHTMLVGVDGQGVHKVSRNATKANPFKQALLFDANDGPHGVLHGNGIYTLLRDSWGNIVVGSYSGGIDIARPVGSTPAIFQHIRNNKQSLLNDRVNCVEQLDDLTLAMGTDNGVSLYSHQTQTWRHTAQGTVVLSLCKTPTGTTLAATYGKGVLEIGADGKTRQLYSKAGGQLQEDHVYKLLYDKDGGLWIGCLNGQLVKKTTDGFRYYDVHYVRDIVQLPDEQMAVGTSYGVQLVSADGQVKELNYQTTDRQEVNKFVQCLYLWQQRQLWIGTDGGGVYIYDLQTKSCQQLTKKEGLPSNSISSITTDSQNRIMIATEQGLAFVSQENPQEAVNVNYCYGIECEYSCGAVKQLANGHLLYGTTTGALVINPANVQRINYSAKLHIMGAEGDEISRSYNERTFDLLFECINLRNQFDIAYQYKMENGEWSPVTDQQYIRFTNLEPGSHTLVLRSISRSCGAVLDEVEMDITIGQPWWNSWWMWCCYILLIALAFYGAWRIYQLHTKYMRLVVNNPNVNSGTLEKTEDADGMDENRTQNNEFIERVTTLVADHLAEPDFNIDRLCREMAMSRTLFYVKLKSYTGKSPQDFIRIIRLEKAAAMLRDNRSVSDAATLTGFDNPKYFSTVFKKYFGVSPSKYC